MPGPSHELAQAGSRRLLFEELREIMGLIEESARNFFYKLKAGQAGTDSLPGVECVVTMKGHEDPEFVRSHGSNWFFRLSDVRVAPDNTYKALNEVQTC